VLPPIAAGGTCLSLRVLRPATQDLTALTRSGTIAPEAAALLEDIIGARLAFLISGGTGAGKTTLLSATLGAVAADERIVCVEDAAELAPAHPHLVKLVARCANVEGVGEVTVRDLVRQALRMRPDRSWSARCAAPRWWIACRPHHRPRRRRRNGTRQQPRGGAGSPEALAGLAGSTARRCTANWPRPAGGVAREPQPKRRTSAERDRCASALR
jgi:hypothetical protein